MAHKILSDKDKEPIHPQVWDDLQTLNSRVGHLEEKENKKDTALHKLRLRIEAVERVLNKLYNDYTKRFRSVSTQNCASCGAMLKRNSTRCPMCSAKVA